MLFRSPFSRRICRAARARKDLGGCREEDVSAAPKEPQAHPRISQAHEDAVWPRDHPSPPPQRPPAADRDDLQEVGRLAPAAFAAAATDDLAARPRPHALAKSVGAL